MILEEVQERFSWIYIMYIRARKKIFSIITIRGSLRRTNTVERKKNFELENFISTIFDIVFNLKNDNSLQEYSFA